MKSFVIAAGLMVGALIAGPAIAHAVLERALPRVGSTVKAAPIEVSLWLTESLEPAFSTIEVRDEKGTRLDKNGAHVDPQNGRRLSTDLAPLGPGTYKVVWRAVSVDTHRTEGDFKFTVAP
jgi:methionine-rich copper-binding protein CopC